VATPVTGGSVGDVGALLPKPGGSTSPARDPGLSCGKVTHERGEGGSARD